MKFKDLDYVKTINSINKDTQVDDLMRKEGRSGKRKVWSVDQKFKIAVAYAYCGNFSEVSRCTGVPVITLRSWKNLPWWKEMLQEIRKEDLEKMSVDMDKVIKKSITALHDRLDEGNYTFDQRTGKVVRVPIHVRDALKITTDLMTKKNIIDKQEVDKGKMETSVERLEKLADEFARFAKAKPVPMIEGEFKLVEEKI